jgi:glyoxylase-like metal-dependent hydrolase (beta-lactamase superfamily II)
MKNLLLTIMLFTASHLSAFAQTGGLQMEGKEVFKNDDVVFHQMDDHTWVGTGHWAFNESLYLVEGNDRAVLIDAGTRIADLDKIVASITGKPVTLIATHVHPDHVGAAGYFPEIYINPADTVAVPQMMKDYTGEIRFLKDGEIIDLGGRQIEVIFTPAHTPGSTTFIDTEAGYGFSGDSFGSGNLLLFNGTFSELIATCEKMRAVMENEGIGYLYPGHYSGDNPESLQRVNDMITLSKDVLSGKVKGEENPDNRFGLPLIISDYGVRINYGEQALK